MQKDERKGLTVASREAVELRTGTRSSWYANAQLTECQDWDDQDPDAYRMLAAPRTTDEIHVHRFDEPDAEEADDDDFACDDWGEQETLIDDLGSAVPAGAEGSHEEPLGCMECEESEPLPGLYAALGLGEESTGVVPVEDADLEELTEDDLVAIDERAAAAEAGDAVPELDAVALEPLDAVALEPLPVDAVETLPTQGAAVVCVPVEPAQSSPEQAAPPETPAPGVAAPESDLALSAADAEAGGALLAEVDLELAPAWLRRARAQHLARPASARLRGPSLVPGYDLQCGATSAPDRPARSMPPRIARRLWRREMTPAA